MKRSILLVSHFFPPSGEVAALRPAALTRHLRALGHRVTVLTTGAYGTDPGDSEGVERTYDLQLLAARLRGRETAPDGFVTGVSRSKPHPLSRVLVPDAYFAAWEPFARRRALQLARREAIDCVITTSPPESTHLIGRRLARRGLAWLADLQDGWSFETPVKEWTWRFGWQRRLNAWLERRVLPHADAVTAVSPVLARDLSERLGVDASVTTMGWEPDDFARLDLDAARRHLDPGRVSIVYTGRIRAAARDPKPLVTAIAELAAEDPDAARRLELVIAGTFTEEETQIMERDVTPAHIRLLGRLPRAEALALQSAGDAALLLTPPRVRYQIPAKTFEYLGARVPILALTEPDGAAAELIREAGAGTVAKLDDVGEIKRALRNLASDGPPAGVPDPWRFANEALIAGFEEAIERAITRRGARSVRRWS